MTFEEWWEKNRQSVLLTAMNETGSLTWLRAAWEAGYTAAIGDVRKNVEEMNKKLFGKE